MPSLRCQSAVARGRFETLEARLVLSAASLADVSLVTHVEAQEIEHCHHDDELHGVDPDGNEYHAIPLVDYNQLGLNSYPDVHRPVQLEGLAETFHLHSNAGATKKIFLDFTGHTTTGTYWNSSFNGGADIVTAAYDFDGSTGFSDAELTRIQRIWQRVAEDFAPFDVDVTTADPGADDLRNYGAGDGEWGIRVVIGGNGSWYGSAGGVAYVGSFKWSSDTPVFVFENNLGNGNERYTAEAISHEVGHSLGLSHDGNSSVGYYTGHGSGETGWAPIMGVGYYKELTQWSRGEYSDANNLQDDLAIISGSNGFGYRADDHGGDAGSASWLATSGTNVSGEGIVERNTDTDVFAFATTGGDINLTFSEAAIGANLDMRVDLYNASNVLVASSNPTSELGASLSLNLAAGDYFVHITGVGQGDPLATGYSDYGSLGQYTVSGTVDGLVDVGAIAFAALEASSGSTVEPGNAGQVAGVGVVGRHVAVGVATDVRLDDSHALAALVRNDLAYGAGDAFHEASAEAFFTTLGENDSPAALTWHSWDKLQESDSTFAQLAWANWASL